MMLTLSFAALSTVLLAVFAKRGVALAVSLRADREIAQLRTYLDWKPDQAS